MGNICGSATAEEGVDMMASPQVSRRTSRGHTRTQSTSSNGHRRGKSNSMTLEGLQRKRKEFWHTRTGGSRIMWDTLKAAAEQDQSMRAVIVESAGLKQFTDPQKKHFLCFHDERGYKYEVPRYCFDTPTNLLDPTKKSLQEGKEGSNTDVNKTPAAEAASATLLNFRVRFSDGGKDVIMKDYADGHDIVSLKDHCVNEGRIASMGSVQFVCYLGKRLKDRDTLKKIGLKDEFTLQFFLTQAPNAFLKQKKTKKK